MSFVLEEEEEDSFVLVEQQQSPELSPSPSSSAEEVDSLDSQSDDEVPTVFVVPPNDSLKCPVHLGVLVDPVIAPCGCSFCRRCIEQRGECPKHLKPAVIEELKPNVNAEAVVRNLLIHCRGGLQQTASGDWVTFPAGCKLWITLGNREEHETICQHVKHYGAESPVRAPLPRSPAPPVSAEPLRALGCCQHLVHGCLFVAHNDEEMRIHREFCGYGQLLQTIADLQRQLVLKDEEIARLQHLLRKQDSPLIDMPDFSGIVQSVTKSFEKLDEDSSRLIEDARQSFQKTKTSLVNSTAFRTSMEVLNSIKDVVDNARMEFVAKLEELEKAAKVKFRALTRNVRNTLDNKPANKTPPNNNIVYVEYTSMGDLNNNNKTDVDNNTTTTTSTVTADDLSSESESTKMKDGATETVKEKSAPDSATNSPVSETKKSSDSVVDDEFEEFLEMSKQEYLKDQQARMAEEESLRRAIKLSITEG